MAFSMLTCEIPKKCWVAVSSGVDSLAACHLIHKMGRLGTVYHYNHGVSVQNDEMEASVRRFCQDVLKGVPLVVRRNKEKGKTEAELRQGRFKILNEYKIDLVTGAHLDDAVESYLLNVFRGKEGFLPIPFVSTFGESRILHPFLLKSKKFFLDYCEKNNILTFVVEDLSNKKIKGSRRNLLRNKIIPILEEEKMGLRTIVKKKILNRLNENSENY